MPDKYLARQTVSTYVFVHAYYQACIPNAIKLLWISIYPDPYFREKNFKQCCCIYTLAFTHIGRYVLYWVTMVKNLTEKSRLRRIFQDCQKNIDIAAVMPEPGAPGGPLADQLTLFEPGRANHLHLLLMFFTFRHHCCALRNVSYKRFLWGCMK